MTLTRMLTHLPFSWVVSSIVNKWGGVQYSTTSFTKNTKNNIHEIILHQAMVWSGN